MKVQSRACVRAKKETFPCLSCLSVCAGFRIASPSSSISSFLLLLLFIHWNWNGFSKEINKSTKFYYFTFFFYFLFFSFFIFFRPPLQISSFFPTGSAHLLECVCIFFFGHSWPNSANREHIKKKWPHNVSIEFEITTPLAKEY